MTNQASEDELKKRIGNLHAYNFDGDDVTVKVMVDEDILESIAKFVEAFIRTEKLKLLNKLDKSMPTDEQLTTKYGYHMPDKQYGYKLALHDIREVLAKLEAEL